MNNRIRHHIFPKIILFAALLIFCGNASFPHRAYGQNTELDLAQAAQQSGTFTTLVSTQSDPVGQEGLWGLEGHFLVPHSCTHSYKALKDVEKYPQRTKAVKRVKLLERNPTSVVVEYTEGAFGLESTSTMLWTFNEGKNSSSITTTTIGPDDPPSWVQIKLLPVKEQSYCNIHVRMFADLSWAPQFILSWMSSMAGEELEASYREIIESAAPESQSVPHKN